MKVGEREREGGRERVACIHVYVCASCMCVGVC